MTAFIFLSLPGCVSDQRSPIREESSCVNLSKPVEDRVSLIQQITTPKSVRLLFSDSDQLEFCPWKVSFLLLSPQLLKNQTPMVTDIPDLGVVSTQQNDAWLFHNDDQQEPTCSNSQKFTSRPPWDTDDGGVHPEDGFSKHEDESEEEVKLLIE